MLKVEHSKKRTEKPEKFFFINKEIELKKNKIIIIQSVQRINFLALYSSMKKCVHKDVLFINCVCNYVL